MFMLTGLIFLIYMLGTLLTYIVVLLFEKILIMNDDVIILAKKSFCHIKEMISKFLKLKWVWILIPIVLFLLLLPLPVLCPNLLLMVSGEKPNWLGYWTCLATLAATAVALYKDDYLGWIKRPILKIEFDNRPPMFSFLPIRTEEKRCTLNTHDNLIAEDGIADGLCCRLKVLNSGCGKAENVFIRIQGKNLDSNFAPMNLKWMNLDVKENKRNNLDSAIMPIVCPKIPYYCNLGKMICDYKKNVFGKFDLYTEVKANDECWRLNRGLHEFELILVADKIAPAYYDLTIDFKDYYRDPKEMMDKGLCIKLSKKNGA